MPVYRHATTAGRSTGWPASIDHASRTSTACDHASGVAENVASPGVKPARPDGARASHTCSGIIPSSFAAPATALRNEAAGRPADSSYSPRSPAKIGHARPNVLNLSGLPMPHGAPRTVSPLAVEREAVPERAVRRRHAEQAVDDRHRVQDDRVVEPLDPSRTSSRNVGSATARWSAVLGPLSPVPYVVGRSGARSFVRRR